ncbi:MAG: hypothetical protein V1875_04315 [Candidatus Altiarchaeota archaeon]
MKHNVNFGLLGFLLLVIIAMIGLVIYSYWTYEGLKKKYDMAISNVENVTEQVNRTRIELLAKEAQLKEKEQALMNFQQDSNDKTQIVLSLKNASNLLDTKVTGLNLTLSQTAEKLSIKTKEADQYYASSIQYKGQLDTANTALGASNRKVDSMRGYAASLDNQVQDLGIEVTSMGGRIRDAKSSVGTIQDNPTNATIVRREASDISGEVSAMETTFTALQGKLNQIIQTVNLMRGT